MVSVSAYHLLGVFLYGYFNYLIYPAIYDNNALATQEIFVWHDIFYCSRFGTVTVTNKKNFYLLYCVFL